MNYIHLLENKMEQLVENLIKKTNNYEIKKIMNNQLVKDIIEQNTIIDDIFNCKENIIVHQVNMHKKMASGIAKQIRERFPNVYEEYMKYDCELGDVGFVIVCKLNGWTDNYEYMKEDFVHRAKEYRCVANLYSQRNYGYDGNLYTDYDAMRKGFKTIANGCKQFDISLAIPYGIGCGLGGANWEIVSQIIVEELADIEYKIYKLKA